MDYQIHIQRIEQRTQRRSRFATHTAFFTGFVLFLIIFLVDQTLWRNFMTLPNTGDLMLIGVVWVVIFGAHSARFWVQETGDRAIAKLTEVEKPKRSFDRLRLDGEGEIVVENPLEQRQEQS